jgi:hypothetical protein
MDDHRRLEELLAAHPACVWMPTQEEDYALGLVRAAAIGAGCDLLIWTVIDGVRDGVLEGGGPVPATENPAAALYHFGRVERPTICVALDLSPHLSDERTMRALRQVIGRFEAGALAAGAASPEPPGARSGGGGCGQHCLVLIDYHEDLPGVLGACVNRFDVSLPDKEELEEILKGTLKRCNREHTLRIDISRQGWESIVDNLRGLTRTQARQVVAETVASDHAFTIEDLSIVMDRKRQLLRCGGLLEFVQTPASLEQIGGLGRLKRWLGQRNFGGSGAGGDSGARAFGLEPARGMLLLGVQGSGKSLCAKAVATSWGRPLLRLDPSVLYDRYIGESERRLREALQQTEMMAPAVLWIDEVEKAFASAASHSIDGGLSQRMFGSLLTWMQERVSPVFVVATANDVEALPPELLRKGRFDEIFFIDLPGLEARKEIFRIHLRKRKWDPEGFDLNLLAEWTDGYSGAEIEQGIIAALTEAFAAKGKGAKIGTLDLVKSLRESPPLSVTMAERVAALRAWADGRCVKAE